MKILVTGVAGFIGFHVAKLLLKRGDTVVGLDNLNGYYDVNLKLARLSELGVDLDITNMQLEVCDHTFKQSTTHANFNFVKLDIADRLALEHLFLEQQFDAVCHLAAQAGVRFSLENPYAYIDSNILGFTNILESCRHQGVTNLCFASSSSVYGLNQSQPFSTDDHTDHPISLYAATKKSNEMMAHTYAHLFGIRTTGLRFFTVYGPWGRPDMAPVLFASAMLSDEPIKVFNHGNMSRDFTYIDDIAAGVVKVIDNPATADPHFDRQAPSPKASSAPYRLYNIGHNSPVSLLDFITTLESVLGKTAKKIMLPMQPGDVKSTYADTSDMQTDFGYTASTDLKTGIAEFAKWYVEYHNR